MHHVVLERWSRGASGLHRRDPRAKIVALLVFLVAVATAHRAPAASWRAMLFALLVAGFAVGRDSRSFRRCCAPRSCSPFTVLFALISWLAGDPARAVALLLKSYLSALAVLLVVSTTPLPVLLRGFEMAGVPRFLLMVAQFLYRYLFVISEEAQHMRKAARSRGARQRGTGRQLPGSEPPPARWRPVCALLRARRRDPPRHAGARLHRPFSDRSTNSISTAADAHLCRRSAVYSGLIRITVERSWLR